MKFRPAWIAVVACGSAAVLAGCATGSTSTFSQAPLIVTSSAEDASEVLAQQNAAAGAEPGQAVAFEAVGDEAVMPVYAAASGAGPSAADSVGQAAAALTVAPAGTGNGPASGAAIPALSATPVSVTARVSPASQGASVGLGTGPVGLTVSNTPSTGTTAGVQLGRSTTTATIAAPVATAAVQPVATLTTNAASTVLGGAGRVASSTPAAVVQPATAAAMTAAGTLLGGASKLASSAPTAVSPTLAAALSNTPHPCVLKLKC